MKRIEQWLRETIGLDAASVGSGMIERAVRQRLKVLGLKRVEDYLQFLKRSRAESQELVESVVVTETWFFREPEVFAALVKLIQAQARVDGPWRLLSVPCATGEEPFSLVIALRDAAVPPDRLQIDGVDISPRALSRAAQGIYPRNSFRGKNLNFRDRYFHPTAGGFALDPAIRESVRFYQGNLLSDDFLPGQATYDFVLCRNLLIYLDPIMRRKALRKLESLLSPSGLLIVGPVEQPLATEHGFVKADIPMAFACRKDGHPARPQRPARLPKRASASHRTPLKPEPRVQRPSAGRPHAQRPVLPPARADLDSARQLAETGRFAEAAAVCEAHLRESRTSAQGYYLLGLVREASGGPDAMDCYRRALYLEPDHYESLVRMALLLQESGETTRARVVTRRAERVKNRS